MDLSVLVRCYEVHYREGAQAELDWFRNQVSLSSAIKYASLAMDEQGKRFPHQYRINREVMQKAKATLLSAVDDLQQCRTFEELLGLIETRVGCIWGLGELYCYDTALRLGAKLNLLPQRVYLHRGTRDGAKALGLDHKARLLEVQTLPDVLQRLGGR